MAVEDGGEGQPPAEDAERDVEGHAKRDTEGDADDAERDTQGDAEDPAPADVTAWAYDTLALLDQGGLCAFALEIPGLVVRSVNGSFQRVLGTAAQRVEGEPVHTLVAEEHHGLVDATLGAIAHGVNVGPMLLSLRPPGASEARPSIWSRITGFSSGLQTTIVMLCQPAHGPETEDARDPLNPEGFPGFGRIPPSPPGWRKQAGRDS